MDFTTPKTARRALCARISCLLLTTLLLASSACKDPPSQTQTPLEAQLATVDFEQNQPIPDAVLLEITPGHIRISLDRIASTWQRASELQDEKVLKEGPWWCTFL